MRLGLAFVFDGQHKPYILLAEGVTAQSESLRRARAKVEWPARGTVANSGQARSPSQPRSGSQTDR
jgi:hypothetical protein